MSASDSVVAALERWHRFVESRDPELLDDLLAEDAVFHSPVVFTPQKGRAITKLYLVGAMNVFGGSGGSDFHYTKELRTDPHAVLEFEVTVDGKLVNGVDILSFDAEGRIREFRVMVRPLQAIQLLHRKMAEMLAKLQAGTG